MSYISLAAGCVIILLIISDIIFTVFAPHGSGFLSDSISKGIWRILLNLTNKSGKLKMLNNSGTIIIVILMFVWLSLLWLGFTLIYCFDTDSVINATTKIPTTTTEKFYYIGYTLSTLGYGDFQGGNQFWQVLSSVISFTGLILITTAITYLVPVTNAEIDKRKLGIYISTLGTTPDQILTTGWNGKNFKDLNDHFLDLIEKILENSQNHLAYPILHYFHTSDQNEASTLNIALLDETLSILIHHVKHDMRPDDQYLLPLRRAITTYLETLRHAFIKPTDNLPEVQDLMVLKKTKIPALQSIIEDKDTLELNDNLEKRRKLIYALLKNDGWDWSDLYNEREKGDLEL